MDVSPHCRVAFAVAQAVQFCGGTFHPLRALEAGIVSAVRAGQLARVNVGLWFQQTEPGLESDLSHHVLESAGTHTGPLLQADQRGTQRQVKGVGASRAKHNRPAPPSSA